MSLPAIDRNNVYKEGMGQIPTDVAYIAEIIDAKITENQYGKKLEVAFDIAEGNFKGYYRIRFEADMNEDRKWKGVLRMNVPKEDGTEQDGWTLKAWNTNLANIEDSNAGYTWDGDEKKLKGKKAGLVFRNKEYEMDGKTGWWSEPYKFINIEDAKAQNFRKPKDKPLANKAQADGFMAIPDDANEELPF